MVLIEILLWYVGLLDLDRLAFAFARSRTVSERLLLLLCEFGSCFRRHG